MIEQEILRRRLYTAFLDKVWKKLEKFKVSRNYSYQIILRYILNKNITRQVDDDPVFIESKSELAEDQVRQDFEYSKISTVHCKEFIDMIEEFLAKSALKIREATFTEDAKVRFERDQMVYFSIRLQDVSHLSSVNVQAAFALNLRYTYLHIKAHNLARTFEKDGYEKDDAAEGFGSSFNHYFHEYCSAFPDLEDAFDSRGSFFDVTEWHHELVFVNPPFDVNLMTAAIRKVMSQSLIMSNTFIFTLPNWSDMKAIRELKSFENTTKVQLYKKGTMPFINYMVDPKKEIFPCDILEITVSKS